MLLWCGAATAQTWSEALSQMPLPAETALNRDNCMRVMLGAFQSNATVCALVFLPAVADDFYLIHRDQQLNLRVSNLWEGIRALTNSTGVRVVWTNGMVLLRLARETPEARVRIKNETAAARLRQTRIGVVVWIDRHWDRLQPELRGLIAMDTKPAPNSKTAWHFGRHNLAAFDISAWDLISAMTLSSGTECAVEKKHVVFQERKAR